MKIITATKWITLTVALPFLALVGLMKWQTTLVTDEQMIEKFNRSRASFEALGKEFQSGHFPKVNQMHAWDDLKPETQAQQQFSADYGAVRISIAHENSRVLLFVDGWGGFAGGPRKGYAWLTNQPPNIVTSLNRWRPTEKQREVYRPIAENWYIWMYW